MLCGEYPLDYRPLAPLIVWCPPAPVVCPNPIKLASWWTAWHILAGVTATQLEWWRARCYIASPRRRWCLVIAIHNGSDLVKMYTKNLFEMYLSTVKLANAMALSICFHSSVQMIFWPPLGIPRWQQFFKPRCQVGACGRGELEQGETMDIKSYENLEEFEGAFNRSF